MNLDLRRMRLLAAATVSLLTVGMCVATLPAQAGPPPKDDAPVLLTPKGEDDDGSDDAGLAKLRDAYYWSRLLAGDDQLSITKAAKLRSGAIGQTAKLPVATTAAKGGGTWTGQGPNPIVQIARTSNTFEAVAGRVSALAIRKDGTVILGAGQGGVWTYDAASGTWTSRTKDASTQSVGALAIAPSNDNVVYMGSGEAALSGDSYFGDGMYRSSDGGVTWKHVSTTFTGQSVSAIAVDPTNANHVYASTLRGRGGNHRTSAPTDQPYGVWESTDGGHNWTNLKGTRNELHGATDLVLDPAHPNVLFASFWGQGIYRSTDGGHTWKSDMGDLPKGNFTEGGTRFSLGISDPAGATSPTLYTGFDYYDSSDTYHPSQVYKSTDRGKHWVATATGSGSDSILGYCGTQCFYDNVVKPDPTNPNVVYVLGLYGYGNSPQSGGIFRSTDGGATWQSLGYDLHPDYHAIAFQPNNTSHIAIGNDGGVWQSFHGGGRSPGEPLSAVDWQDLNGQVDPATTALIHSTGLAITMFDSIASVPNVPGQYWGGTQDNGTLRKSTANQRWYDQAGGDGGQVIVDQTTPNTLNPTVPAFVFGSYYGISPYRYNPSTANTFNGNEGIDGGIDKSDRAEFYVPWTENRGNTNQMFLGTYRVYRTDNAETPSAGDVHWDPISPDLTSGCLGSAPNGARGCLISTVGVADGGTGVYAGTDEGWIQVSPDAVSAATPTWHRVGVHTLPNRPVNQIAVDRSNWRIAYAAYGGFSAATPNKTGHLYATADGGTTWTNITGGLPDVPIDSVVIDPSHADTLYVGTDVGPFVTTDGGAKWYRLGTGMPKVANWQLDYDASQGTLVSGTHGRGAYTLTNRGPLPALTVAKTASSTPIGPGSSVHYTLTIRNFGNAAATGVTVTDPLPGYTSGASASDGGTFSGNGVTWRNLTIGAGETKQLDLVVQIRATLPKRVTRIVNDGITVTSAQRVGTTGSPTTTAIAPPHAVSITPTTAIAGAKVGEQASFVEHITNNGYLSDTYSVHPSVGGWPAGVYDATCTTPISTTPAVAPGASTDVCVKVDIPADAADNARNDTTITATSTADPAVSASATLTSIAVAKATLVVDEDTNAPVDSAPYYENALTTDGVDYSYWDLTANPVLPQSYLTAHKTVVWFTGNSYPAPITPYESELKALLDGGGRLFLSGQDVLDQAAGTTPFVHDYLHVDWDGTETQNDKATAAVHAVPSNPVTAGLGSVPLDHSVLAANYEDEITPIDPAAAAFTDDAAQTDGLTVADGPYKVVFLAFPFEAYGTAADKAELMQRAVTFFDAP